MFELPEFTTLAKQINETLEGQVVQKGCLGNSPHKFVWYNLTHAEFEQRIRGKTVGHAYAKGKWLFIPMNPGYVLLFGECGGKMLYHPTGAPVPAKYHLYLTFEDGSFFTVMTQMWGAMELYERGQERERKYVKGMRPTPVEPEFTYKYFSALIDTLATEKKRSAKALLTAEQLVPGLGNSIAQDILFKAKLNPKHSIAELDKAQRRALYDAIIKTTRAVIAKGGRNDEYDLFDHPGKYVRLMDSQAAGKPCPVCKTKVQKIQYLGGACYFCPRCQK